MKSRHIIPKGPCHKVLRHDLPIHVAFFMAGRRYGHRTGLSMGPMVEGLGFRGLGFRGLGFRDSQS